METITNPHRRVNNEVKQVLMLPEEHYPNRSTLHRDVAKHGLGSNVHLFKPYQEFQDIEPYITRQNRSLAKKVDTYIHDLVDDLGTTADYFYTGNGLRKHYGLPKLEDRLMRFNVLLGEGYNQDIDERRQEFQEARQHYFKKDSGKFFPVKGSLFDSVLQPVYFSTTWDTDNSDDSFRVKSVIERSDMGSLAADLLDVTARDIAAIAFYNTQAFENQHEVFMAGRGAYLL